VSGVHFLSVLLFVVSANIDNLIVCIAYGTKKIKIGFRCNLLIACIIAVGTYLSMLIGLTVVKVLPESLANAAGSMILILIGLWIAKDFFWKPKKVSDEQTEMNLTNCNQILQEPEKADSDHSGTIDLKESFFLALALTINNFGLGIGASLTGLNVLATVGCTFLFSLVSIPIGCHMGKKCISTFGEKYVSLVSGLVIILMGVYELLV
jgi:putative sporulation protein YtaF